MYIGIATEEAEKIHFIGSTEKSWSMKGQCGSVYHNGSCVVENNSGNSNKKQE